MAMFNREPDENFGYNPPPDDHEQLTRPGRIFAFVAVLAIVVAVVGAVYLTNVDDRPGNTGPVPTGTVSVEPTP